MYCRIYTLTHEQPTAQVDAAIVVAVAVAAVFFVVVVIILCCLNEAREGGLLNLFCFHK